MCLPSEDRGKSCVSRDNAAVSVAVSVSFADDGIALDLRIEPVNAVLIRHEISAIILGYLVGGMVTEVRRTVDALVVLFLKLLSAALLQGCHRVMGRYEEHECKYYRNGKQSAGIFTVLVYEPYESYDRIDHCNGKDNECRKAELKHRVRTEIS